MLFPAKTFFYSRSRSYLIGFFTVSVLLLWGACEFYVHFGALKIHLRFLNQVHKGQYLVVLHPGIYWMTNILSWLSGLTLHAALNVLLSIHVLLAFFAGMWALMLLSAHRMDAVLCAGLALALLFVGPIGIPFVNTQVYDFARFNRSFLMLRNSTSIGMLPYALAALGLLGSLLNGHVRGRLFPVRLSVLAATFLVLSCIMKPSLAISLIPAIMVYVVCSKRFDMDDVVMAGCMLAPAAFIVVMQFFIGFIFNPASSQTIHIVFSPMAVWLKNNQYPLLELILALAFPIAVTFFRRRSLSSLTIIAWINLCIALVPYMLLDEVAVISTSSDRDFEWSYVIAKQALFLTCFFEWWCWRGDSKRRGATFATVLLAVHVVFGVSRLLMVDAVDVSAMSGAARHSAPLPLSGDSQ